MTTGEDGEVRADDLTLREWVLRHWEGYLSHEDFRVECAIRAKREQQADQEVRACELGRRARETEGDSDNPLRVAAANKLYSQAAAIRKAQGLNP
jgi:hypothetical protein